MESGARLGRNSMDSIPQQRRWTEVVRSSRLSTDHSASPALNPGVDVETGAITVRPDPDVASSSLPPGVAAQSSALALLPLFVAPAPRGGIGPLHSPNSQKKLLGQPALLNVMHSLLDEPIAMPGDGQQVRRSLTERFEAMAGREVSQLEAPALRKASLHWQNEELHATLDTLAREESLYRSISSAFLKQARGLQVQQLSRGELALGYEADHKAMHDVLAEMLGKPPAPGASLWNYMYTTGPSQPNFLITVVKLNGEPVWRWFSASGGKYIPVDRQTGALRFRLTDKRVKKGVHHATVPRLKPSENVALCNVQASLDLLAPKPNPSVRYVGYPDLLVGKQGAVKEARLLPRTFTLDGKGELHERSRDTEYAVMSAMALILETYPLKQDDQLDIAMFSKLPMCSSCQNAVSAALTLPQFSRVTGFRIFS